MFLHHSDKQIKESSNLVLVDTANHDVNGHLFWISHQDSFGQKLADRDVKSIVPKVRFGVVLIVEEMVELALESREEGRRNAHHASASPAPTSVPERKKKEEQKEIKNNLRNEMNSPNTHEGLKSGHENKKKRKISHG